MRKVKTALTTLGLSLTILLVLWLLTSYDTEGYASTVENIDTVSDSIHSNNFYKQSKSDKDKKLSSNRVNNNSVQKYERNTSSIINGVSKTQLDNKISSEITKPTQIPKQFKINDGTQVKIDIITSFDEEPPRPFIPINIGPDTVVEWGCSAKVKPVKVLEGSEDDVDTVLILTPVSSAAGSLSRYWKLLCSLSYPHQLISVALAEDSSDDESREKAKYLTKLFSKSFRRTKFYHFKESLRRPINRRHDLEYQLPRRSHLAKVRNKLLSMALTDEKWVFWMDADLAYIPRDLLQQLMSQQKDVIVPSCMYENHERSRMEVYDRNSWRETRASLAFQAKKDENYLMVEGYMEPSQRHYLPSLFGEGAVVPLDGIGGCAILVLADCHRKGLMFPTFVYKHHIETEGLAKLATDMGYGVYGMPRLHVLHQ